MNDKNKEKGMEFISMLGEALIDHSISTLNNFHELPESASKEGQGKLLAALSMQGVLKIASIMAAFDIDMSKIGEPKS